MINRLKVRLGSVLMKVSARLRWPWLTAVAMKLSLKPLGGSGDKPLVFCVIRTIFADDVKAMSEYGGRFRYAGVYKGLLEPLLDCFIDGWRTGLSESDYHRSDYGIEGREALYRHWLATLPTLMALTGAKAFLSGNFSYLQQQELARACGDLKIPFLVLHKEGVAVPELYAEYAKVYRGHRFVGTKMLFYNERIQAAMLAEDIDGLTEENSVVVGIPRFDPYFDPAAAGDDMTKRVIFFSFFISDKIFYLANTDEERERFQQVTDDFHREVMEFARRNSEYTVTIKTKNGPRYIDYVHEIYQREFNTPIDNLIITNVGSAPDYIRESKAVIAFNSTTQIEAVAAGKLLIGPEFEGFDVAVSHGFFASCPDLLKLARRAEDIERLVGKANLLHREDDADRKKFLKLFLPTPFAESSLRAEQEIILAIGAHGRS